MSPVARLVSVGLAYGKTRALDGISVELPAGKMVGLIGPDGVGKSTLLSLVAGARALQEGTVEVLGGDMRRAAHRKDACPRIAYMPQGLGKNLYPTLSVEENVDFFARLFGQGAEERRQRIRLLLERTGLLPFAGRPAGNLSGGMKQKLGLCCALIHDPDLLVLDEPTTGVDPLSRRQFWELLAAIRAARPTMSVLVATAYLEEAEHFDWILAMDAGRVLATGTPAELRDRTGTTNLDDAFIALLPADRRAGHEPVRIPARDAAADGPPLLEAEHLTMRFDAFTAVDDVSFAIPRGEIFGFLGSNGCGKTTTMKMLTGLLAPSGGTARLLGRPVDAGDMAVRRRVGYMSQGFSLYGELTVAQNLELHARLFGLPPDEVPARVARMAERFELGAVLDSHPESLPLGVRQRLSLAVAMIHGPEILILDEPTSGVDPVARDRFWRVLGELSRSEGVTIFVSTHFMNEAERCDRVSLMHAGRVLVSAPPADIARERGGGSLEAAFIAYLEEASGEGTRPPTVALPPARPAPRARGFDLRRLLAVSRREATELRRDPIRATLAILGTVLLMFVIGYGINMDVENLTFAVLDRDDTPASRDYAREIAGSRYFVERPALHDYAELDRRMRSGELALALEIPPDFERQVSRGHPVAIGAWVDGAMPSRAETVRGYVQGMHATWLAAKARERGHATASSAARLEVRYRYNPSVESLVAMVPATIPILLMMIPAMLTALSVVREKEIGSIINFYVTPTTRLEFLVGKQLPYFALAVLNGVMLTALAIFAFRVPFTGSLVAYGAAVVLYVAATTALGLVVSTFMKSQIAAVFGTAILTMIPTMSFSGIVDPVSSLSGGGRIFGEIFPATHFVTIARGTFSKALSFPDLGGSFVPLLLALPVLLVVGAAFSRKQAA